MIMSLSYLLQVSIIWGLSYLFYRWWLSGEKLLKANRVFLLAAMIAGPLLPFLPRPDLSSAPQAPLPALANVQAFLVELQTIDIADIAPQQTFLGGLSWFHWIWILGATLFLARMIKGWWHIHRLWQSGERKLEDGVISVRIPELSSPFSYGRLLFWPQDADRNTREWQPIWAHERAHIKQGHSLDLLVTDILLIIFWWHPLPYLFRRALRLQHEYLADAAGAEQEKNHRAYARLLLKQHLVGWVPKPSHAFHNSHIKNRIIMLTQPQGAGWKLVAILPLLLAIFWACEKEADITGASIAETEEKLAQNDAPETGAFKIIKDTIITFNPETQEENTQIVESKLYMTVDQMPVFGNCTAEQNSEDEEELKNCSNLNLLTAVYENLKYPESARDAGLEGMVVVQFVIPSGKVGDFDTQIKAHSAKIIRSSQPAGALPTAAEKAGYEAMDAAVLNIIKNLPANWTPGIHQGEAVNVQFNLPVRFRLE